MLRKELLDARKALRSVREGESGPRIEKQRGEWELVSIQNMYCSSIKWFVEDHAVAGNYTMHTQLSGTDTMEIKTR